jgi:hypothetical protein
VTIPTLRGFYRNARYCEWSMIPPTGYRMHIHFDRYHFSTEGGTARGAKCSDPFFVWDSDRRDNMIEQGETPDGSWCGDDLDPVWSWSAPFANGRDGNFTSTNGPLHFLWGPDIDSARRGWTFTYEVVPI